MGHHTPGPWHSVGGLVVSGRIESETVCQVFKPTVEGDGDANSRLIAAAPALLEALRDIEDMIAGCPDAPRNPDSLPQMVLEQARAAIAKATTP